MNDTQVLLVRIATDLLASHNLHLSVAAAVDGARSIVAEVLRTEPAVETPQGPNRMDSLMSDGSYKEMK